MQTRCPLQVHAGRTCLAAVAGLPRSEQIAMRREALGTPGRAIWEASVYSQFLPHLQICVVIQTSQSAVDI